MKKLLCVVGIVLVCASIGAAQCTKIKDGGILAKDGTPVTLGYDKYGYNYQAHIFNGLEDNYLRPPTPVTSGALNLVMKWSDDWLSNQDCNGDGKLDRGLDLKTGLSDGISKGWCTNHFEGDYLDPNDNQMHHYNEEIKIVYVGPAPTDGSIDSWADKRLWGSYAIIEDVINEDGTSFHGVDKSLLANPAGLGFYTN